MHLQQQRNYDRGWRDLRMMVFFSISQLLHEVCNLTLLLLFLSGESLCESQIRFEDIFGKS